MQPIQTVSIIGAGNMGTQLVIALHEAGIKILQICSRSEHYASSLSGMTGADYITDPAMLNDEADVYFFAIPDKALHNLPENKKLSNKLIVHTSGSTALKVIENFSSQTGVFYPLQTFSKERKLNFSEIPICIEANNPEAEQKLMDLGSKLSKNVYRMDSEKRKILHLSAVIACNFSNFMYIVASNLLEENDLSFDLLKPLILETSRKAVDAGPLKAQTGPAFRSDKETIRIHLELLHKDPEYQEIYRLMTQYIQKLSFNL